MKSRFPILLFAPILILVATPALAGGNANFTFGVRGLDKDFWGGLDNQGVFGVTVDFGKEAWPIHLEVGAAGSGATDKMRDPFLPAVQIDVTGGVGEVTFGVNKTWKPASGSYRPYIGGGVASVSAKTTIETTQGDVDEDDSSFGVYFHGGVFWRIGTRFNLGVDGRLMGGTKITLFDNKGDANYGQVALLLGWGWPVSK
jgi:hypothetical protein